MAAFLILALLYPFPAHSISSPWKTNAHGRVRLIAPYKVAPDKGLFFVGVQFEPVQGWHVYWRNAGDAGYAPKMDWKGSTGMSEPQILWPAPQRMQLPGDITDFGYEKVIYPVRMKRATGPLHLNVEVNYLTCGTSCVPHSEVLALDMPSGLREETDPADAQLLESAMQQIPVPVEQAPDIQLQTQIISGQNGPVFEALIQPQPAVKAGRLDLFFDKADELQFGKPMVQWLPGNRYRLSAPISSTSPVGFRHALLNYTLTGLARDHRPLAVEETKTFDFFIPSAGALQKPVAVPSGPALWFLGLALLGGLLLNVMPCVLPVLSIKLFGLLRQSGGSRLIIVRNALASAAGIWISFLALAGAAVLAKEAGYAVGWGVQFQEPVFVALLFLVIGLFALNLWDLFEISLPASVSQLGPWTQQEGAPGYFFSGLLATLLATPCSAPFLGTAVGFALSQSAGVIMLIFLMVGTGMALPYLLLAVFPGALAILPRPGAWMQRVRFFLGFFLAGTALWLGYVLAGEVSARGRIFFYGLSAVIGILCIVRHRVRLKGKYLWSVLLMVILLGLGIAALNVVDMSRSASVNTNRTAGKNLLAWQPFDEAEIRKLADEGRKVFVDVSADWCFTCKVNEATVLETPAVAEAFAQQDVVLMKADWTNRNETIARYMQTFGRFGIPFYVYYAPGKSPLLLSELLTKRKVLDALKG
jgi:suppressor for copper-sensitivity B